MPRLRARVILWAMKRENSRNNRAPMSVLLVEDAAPVRQRLCALIAEVPSLRLIGQAATVAEAINLIDTSNPTAVVLDLGLPDGTGIDVLRHVRETNSQCVVIILSNYLDLETYNRCSELGADFLFSKSDEFEQAIETLRALSHGTEKGMHDKPEARRVRRAKLAVTSPIGIHARPAAMLVRLAQSYDADIEISLNGNSASAKSILGVMTLCAGYGAEVTVAAVGTGAEEAIRSITALFECGFHERRDAVAPGASVTSSVATTPLRSKGDTILVADDEAGIRDIVKRILEGVGYQTVTACNGVEAIALLTANGDAIKAVLLDMIMPEMSGLDAMSAIRRISPNLPVLAMSGFERPPANDDAATAFLRKPFGRAELVPALRSLLDRASLGQPTWAPRRERRVES